MFFSFFLWVKYQDLKSNPIAWAEIEYITRIKVDIVNNNHNPT